MKRVSFDRQPREPRKERGGNLYSRGMRWFTECMHSGMLASHQSALLLSCMKAATLIGGMQGLCGSWRLSTPLSLWGSQKLLLLTRGDILPSPMDIGESISLFSHQFWILDIIFNIFFFSWYLSCIPLWDMPHKVSRLDIHSRREEFDNNCVIWVCMRLIVDLWLLSNRVGLWVARAMLIDVTK